MSQFFEALLAVQHDLTDAVKELATAGKFHQQKCRWAGVGHLQCVLAEPAHNVGVLCHLVQHHFLADVAAVDAAEVEDLDGNLLLGLDVFAQLDSVGGGRERER